jgi:LytS/YehU family sensor histidine kinase
VVRDYIALLQVHHEERLQVQWQVAPDTAGASLPPMVLQLLVENAVKHGIAQTPGGGTVAIAIARTRPEPGAPLRVQVSNPGRWQPGPEAGIGLANQREQLQRVGGPGATCEIEDRDGSVHVTLTIPP